MNFIVTGGAGFIGSHIVDALLAEGNRVVVIDNLSSGRMENLDPRAVFYNADVRDTGIAGIFEKERPEVVVHEAAQVSVRRSVDDPVYDADVNILGALHVLQACVKSGVKKVVFASSGGAIYGEQDVFPAPEGHPIKPVSPYGTAKYSVEVYLKCYREMYGLDYVALRYSNVYGPRQDPHGEAGVVAIFTEKMLAGQTPTINGDGEQTRDYVYVADVVNANISAIDHGYSGSFNVGTGVETSVNELFGMIKEETGFSGERVHGPAKAGEQKRSVIDNCLIRAELGWRPNVPLKEGIGRTVEFFKGRVLAGND